MWGTGRCGGGALASTGAHGTMRMLQHAGGLRSLPSAYRGLNGRQPRPPYQAAGAAHSPVPATCSTLATAAGGVVTAGPSSSRQGAPAEAAAAVVAVAHSSSGADAAAAAWTAQHVGPQVDIAAAKHHSTTSTSSSSSHAEGIQLSPGSDPLAPSSSSRDSNGVIQEGAVISGSQSSPGHVGYQQQQQEAGSKPHSTHTIQQQQEQGREGQSGGPSLRHVPASHQAALGDLLQATPAQVQQLVSRHPSLLTLTPEQLTAHSQAAQQALSLSAHRLPGALVTQPRLLLWGKADVEARLKALAEALGWTQQQAAVAVALRPGLLSAQPATLQTKLRLLRKLLLLSSASASKLAQALPAVLEYSPDTLRKKVTSLQRLVIGTPKSKLSAAAEPAPARSTPKGCKQQQQQQQQQEAVLSVVSPDGPSEHCGSAEQPSNSNGSSSSSTDSSSLGETVITEPTSVIEGLERAAADGSIGRGAATGGEVQPAVTTGAVAARSQAALPAAAAAAVDVAPAQASAASAEASASGVAAPRSRRAQVRLLRQQRNSTWADTRPVLQQASQAVAAAAAAGAGSTPASTSTTTAGSSRSTVTSSSSSEASSKPISSRRLLGQVLLSEPGLLTRSSNALYQRAATLQTLLGVEDKRLLRSLLQRRPALLTRSTAAVDRSMRALSVWKMAPGYKLALVLAHPALLRLSGAELHGRCDWVRQLMLRSAWLHSTLRELPPACFGALLLHLPACWQRLAFLVESQQEVGCQVMWTVQCRPGEFAAKFPEFAKWRAYGEQATAARVAPWKVGLRRSEAADHQQRQQQQQQQAGNDAAPGVQVVGGKHGQQQQQWVCAQHAAVHSQDGSSSSSSMPRGGPGNSLRGSSSSSSASRGGGFSRQRPRQHQHQLRACANCPVVLQQAADSWCEVHEAPCTVLIGGRRVSKPGRHFAGSGAADCSPEGVAPTEPPDAAAAAAGSEGAAASGPALQEGKVEA